MSYDLHPKELEFHLLKWACINRVVAETGKPVTQVLTDFNNLVVSAKA